MKTIYTLFLILCMLHLQAQTKNEKEIRVKKSEVPKEVKHWFKDAYENQRKVKWFFQTDGEKQVYEAKLTYKGKKHSVEILPNGDVVNIEVQLALDEIQPQVKRNLEDYFNATYQRFRIKKIQIQYNGSNDDLEDLIDEDEMDEDIIIRYEIEFLGKNETENELWEGLFDDEGNLLERRKIIVKSTDNLDY